GSRGCAPDACPAVPCPSACPHLTACHLLYNGGTRRRSANFFGEIAGNDLASERITEYAGLCCWYPKRADISPPDRLPRSDGLVLRAVSESFALSFKVSDPLVRDT